MPQRNHFRDHIRQLPVYQKAQQILQLVDAISTLVDSDNSRQKESIQYMLELAHLIPAKIAGAEGAGLYDVKMQNAALIRQSAMDLITTRHSLEMEGFPHKDYLKLIPHEIEEFRVLFTDWVSTFDPWDYIIDRWGMFNPPGVSPDDKKPDEDLPFADLDTDLD